MHLPVSAKHVSPPVSRTAGFGVAAALALTRGRAMDNSKVASATVGTFDRPHCVLMDWPFRVSICGLWWLW
jgi:hypothetical protein